MMTTKRYRSKIAAAVHEAMVDVYDVGGIDKKTMREFDVMCLTVVDPLGPDDIRSLREREAASQAVFARVLNVTPGLVSQWERGEKRPRGATLKLLTLVKERGLMAMA